MTTVPTYTCQSCDKQYHIYASYYTHLQSHKDTVFPCENCGREYKRQNSMKLHSYGCVRKTKTVEKPAEKPAEKLVVIERKEPPANKLSNYMFNLE